MNSPDDVSRSETRETGGGFPVTPPVIEGVTPPEGAEFLRNMIEAFNQAASGLQNAYSALQTKFDRLNLRLEETNRHLSESLAEQERLSDYLTNILESLSSGVLVVDAAGVITLFNRGASEMTGIPESEAAGRPYREVMGGSLADTLTPLGTLATGTGVSQLEKTIVSRTGEKIAVGYSVSPLLNRHGGMTGAVEIFMNLSRIKALEDEISRMDKLAALGQMAATMAHKIRNPLGGITGFAGLLELEGSERGKRLAGKILEGADKLNRIVTSLVSYTSPPRLIPRRVDLGEIMREIAIRVESERRGWSHDSVISVLEPEGPVTVELDVEQFSDAAAKVVENALEALDDTGTVSIAALPGDTRYLPRCPLTAELLGVIRGESRLSVSRMPAGIVTVTDYGCGIRDEDRERLFVPFFTTKENGIGLGLVTARKIIEAHHGELWLVSRAGGGTSVGMVVPCVSTAGGEPSHAG